MPIEDWLVPIMYLSLVGGGLFLANKIVSARFSRKGGEKAIYTQGDINRIRGVYEEQVEYLKEMANTMKTRAWQHERPSPAIAKAASALSQSPMADGSIRDFANQLWDELVPARWKMALGPVRDGVIGGIEDRIKKDPEAIARLITKFSQPAKQEEAAQYNALDSL